MLSILIALSLLSNVVFVFVGIIIGLSEALRGIKDRVVFLSSDDFSFYDSIGDITKIKDTYIYDGKVVIIKD